MKKLFLAVALVLCIVGVVSAEPLNIGDELQKLPALDQGIAYSIIDSTINYTSTFEIMKIGERVSLGGGYATNGSGDTSDHKGIGTITVNLLNLGDYIKFPILDQIKINPGIYVGASSINIQRIMESEPDFGIIFVPLSLKF